MQKGFFNPERKVTISITVTSNRMERFSKSLLGNSSIGYEWQILFYTALDFFKIAAGYLCKIRLV